MGNVICPLILEEMVLEAGKSEMMVRKEEEDNMVLRRKQNVTAEKNEI